MQLVSYRPHAGTDEAWRAGVEHKGLVADVVPLWHGNSHEVTTRQLLAAGPAVIESVFKQAREILAAGSETSGVFQVASVELGPPVPDPDKIICIGVNYADHASEAGLAQTSVPLFFAKFRNSLTGPTSPILLPRVSSQIDYEGELAVISGTRCKDVSEQEALSYVAGYTIMNDVSARDLQMQTSQYIAGKALDTFAPMGPGIVLASAIPDPRALLLTTRVNGQEVQHASTASMIFSVAAIISFLSSLMALEPGDIIATGTPSGVGFKRTPPLFLQHGDVVEVEIEGIGQLRNSVVGTRTEAGAEREK
ncbi:MAG TPA: fumarylacetoacetate hydrolase family protein [Ktedonobacteraceae bacterium]|nr:fumarylacetoacetate hydrolase family protein [Ktedonobacteraceae bacterium]HZU69570.1 fumarylacetoacetate hydrolase family protein [Ktedonobacteraceae bacterium]